MNKLLPLLVLGALSFGARAQTPAPANLTITQPFGKVDNEDFELKACPFEKDANAEVLFNKGNLYYGSDLLSITEEVHKRIKIFNDNGKHQADIRIRFYSNNHLE